MFAERFDILKRERRAKEMADRLVNEFRANGYLLLENIFAGELMNEARSYIDTDLAKWKEIMLERGRAREAGSVAHHVLVEQHWVDFLQYLEPYELFRKILNSQPVVNAFGVLDNSVNKDIYVNADHIDQRFVVKCEETLMINILIFVDEFTSENGGTWIYPGSHIPESNGSRDIQITGKSGSMLIWDSRLLHRAGTNTTGVKRRAISAMISRPWIKPQFDYASNATTKNLHFQDDKVLQLLGIRCQLNQSLDDWYSNSTIRKYERNQDDWFE